jgi:ribosomal protein L12E/L44/L45/RPP1/RPP2
LGRKINKLNQELPMLKMILATVVAGAFLISTPVRAEDKAAAPAGEKAEKGKKEKKEEKAPKKEEKAGGGW